MYKKILSIMLCFLLIVSTFTGCGNKPDDTYDENNKIKIVVTNYVLADFARQIGGENVEVEVLLNSGENSLTHTATNKDIAKINEADVFIHNGQDAEPWVYEATESLENGNILIINVADGISVKNSKYNINEADNKDYILNSKDPNYKNPNDNSDNENGDGSSSGNNTNNDSNSNQNNTGNNSNNENNNSNQNNNESNSNQNNNTEDNNSNSNQNNSSSENNTNNDSNSNQNNTENNSNNENNNSDQNNNESNSNQNNNTGNNNSSSENNKPEEIVPTLDNLIFVSSEPNFKKLESTISISGTTKDGYTLKTLPKNYGFHSDPFFEVVSKKLQSIENAKGIGIFNGTDISVFIRDDFYGDFHLGRFSKISDLSRLSGIYFDEKSHSYLTNLLRSSIKFSELSQNEKLRLDVDSEKAVYLILETLYQKDVVYYCLYNDSNNKPELFAMHPIASTFHATYLGKINSPNDILKYTTYGKVICDAKSYAYFNGSNKNATTETKQYHNYCMDLNNAKVMVKNVYDGIISKDSKNTDFYTENYNNYIELIDSLDIRFKKLVENSTDKFVIITGEFHCYYFLRYLDLEYMSVYDYEFQETNPSIIRQSNIVEFINKNSDTIKYVLTEGDNTITTSICKETGVTPLEINSLYNIDRKNQYNEEYSYINIMENNYIILKTALN